MNLAIFHLAFPVSDIAQAKAFYAEGLGCEVGRESATSVILNLAGHQIVAHLSPDVIAPQQSIYPRHFGLIFTDEADWEALLTRSQQQGLTFYQSPKKRFVGLPLEHRTFFLVDPFHNVLEFKFYRHAAAIFGEVAYTQVGDAQ